MQEETLKLDLKGLESFCEDVSLNLKPGDIICLFGELGSGKTTVVRNLINSIYKRILLLLPLDNVESLFKYWAKLSTLSASKDGFQVQEKMKSASLNQKSVKCKDYP